MKRIILSLFAVAAYALMLTAQNSKCLIQFKDGTRVTYSVDDIDNMSWLADDKSDDHEWVDLGLPSQTLWATCNVGADSPEKYGYYFAWGDTEAKTYFPRDYTFDGKIMDVAHDAATVNWGAEWYTPSSEQCEELLDSRYTTTEWTNYKGVDGLMVTSLENGKSIFLPAAGYYYNASLSGYGKQGSYATSTIYEGVRGLAYYMYLASGESVVGSSSHFYGQTVRPVRNKANASSHNGHKWVDLGLPSGVKWATCNVGAVKPEDYGWYLAWGETEEKEVYDWSTYKHMTEGYSSWEGISKYQTSDGQTGLVWYVDDYFIGDEQTELHYEDDAARVNRGGNWRMPTVIEMDELCSECVWLWESRSGVEGYTVVGPNGNSIFLPAAGLRSAGSFYYAGSEGFYWSSSLIEGVSAYAWYVGFKSDKFGRYGFDRSVGQSVRPVCSE